MGCSQGSNGGCCCCPSGQIFQEQICGNFLIGAAGGGVVWSAPPGDFFEGTFEVFNSAASPGPVTGTVDSATVTPEPGNSVAVTVLQPNVFTITGTVGASGKYCITLYKRVLA